MLDYLQTVRFHFQLKTSLFCLISDSRYAEHSITDLEFNSLNGRMQEQIKRTAAANLQNMQPQQAAWGYYPAPAPERLRRVDWLREKVYFEGLVRDDHYAKTRLGFKAPDIFVMELVT